MRKRSFISPISIISFLFALFISLPLSAQFLPAVDPADLVKEAPITQKDVDFAIKYCQLLKLFNVDKIEGAADQILDFLDNSGFTIERQVYAVRKVTITALLVSGGITVDEIKEDYLKPNALEKSVVERNLDALVKAINEAYPPE
jgi:hypothetical protein